jgi:hypothetical protein
VFDNQALKDDFNTPFFFLDKKETKNQAFTEIVPEFGSQNRKFI